MEIFKKLKIVQEISNEGRNPKLGRGFSTAKRLNKYNPLSYVVIVLVFISVLVMDGIRGVINLEKSQLRTPFKWD